MNYGYLLTNETAKKLFDGIKGLPIVDYHCHLSPKEICENKPFENVGEIWLSGDHYKWRLMRIAGVPEELITGGADWKTKFKAYADVLEQAPGNPLYAWSHMELSKYFGIEKELNEETADEIYEEANRVIREHPESFSPRGLICRSNVETVCTTDDPADTLEWHERIREDASFTVRVLPSFRPDNALLLTKPGFREYMEKLGSAAGIRIEDLGSLKEALRRRLRYFVSLGCRVADVGIPYFPDRIGTGEEAGRALRTALCPEGTEVSADRGAYMAFLGHMFVFLAGEYAKYGILSQIHFAVERNTNSVLFERVGADAGADTAGDPVSGRDLIRILDAETERDGLPKTILYSLNDAFLAEYGSIAGAFRGVSLGAAWWFNDHEGGIRKQLFTMAETGALGRFYGMLTDSRSFLSYARHDYFREILSSVLSEWVERGALSYELAEKTAKKIAYENSREVFA